MMRKVLVVSGGTKGIGKAIVHKFASQGFDIVTCSRNESDLKSLQTEVEELNKEAKVFIFKADLSLRSQVAEFSNFILKLNRPVDVLVNNTGVFFPGQIHSEDEGILEKVIETNVYSAYHLTRGLISEMKARKRGHIFNICSTASITPYTNGGSYCISKYALLGFSKVLREEMKEEGIKVTSVLPGATFTSSWEGAGIPEERFMKADDVAKIIYTSWNLSDSAVMEEILLRPQLGDI